MSFLQEFQMSEKALATFAAGMREVACADDEIHPNELNLIDNLTAGLELDEVVDLSSLNNSTAKENFMLTLALVAVADGKLLDSEIEVINKYHKALGARNPVADYIEMAALSLLAQYSEAELEVIAPRLGKSLGLSEEGIIKAMSSLVP